MVRLLPPLATCLLHALLAGTPAASTAPTTPTFVLAWGSIGGSPGQLAFPRVATDIAGNVFVADQGNHRIQKFDRLGNWIAHWGSTGSGNGQFTNPMDVAIDVSGSVYVVDQANHRIQKFSNSGVYVTKWGTAGSGDGQFIFPTGIATDLSGNVYVADAGNHRIQKFTSAGGYLAQWGTPGVGDGQFDTPNGVATDAFGNIYVTDTNNHRVQKFSNAGAYAAQWGGMGAGNGQLNAPWGISTDAVGNVYVADTNNNRIQKFSGSGAFLTAWGGFGGGSGQFNGPASAATDAAGNVYVADRMNHRIQKFSGAGAALAQPPAAFLLKWGTMGTGDGQLSTPYAVATDASGNVFVADFGNNRIQKFSSTGTYLSKWGTGGTGNSQFDSPTGVAVDPSGNVYVADTDNNRIQKFNNSGAYLTQWGSPGAGNGQFNGPVAVAYGAGGIYVADVLNRRIQRFSTSGTYLSQWGSFGSGNGQFVDPWAVAADAAGNVYVADRGNHRIQKFSSTGSYIAQWGSQGSGNGMFGRPSGVVADASGNIYVADLDNYRVQKFSGAGVYLTQWGAFGSGNGQFNPANGVAVDVAGNVYVADQLNHRIQKFANPPAIALVSDVGNDQGRQARLRIWRSSADALGSGSTVLRYDVFRRIDPLPSATSALAASAPPSVLGTGASSPEGVQLAGWDQVGSFSARGDAEYNVVVPTLVDATAVSLEYSAFFVSAATADPLTYYDSEVENGFSIDNLPPPAPAAFTAAYVMDATHLRWDVSVAVDFATFRLYRGSSDDFVPGSGNLIAATLDTGYVDAGPAGSYYKLAAVDINGNEGPYALVGPDETVDAPAPAPVAFALEGMRPNPSTGGRILVHLALPIAAPARLELFDVVGRILRERDLGSLGAGRHVVELTAGPRLGPGIYFLRLTQGEHQRVVRAALTE